MSTTQFDTWQSILVHGLHSCCSGTACPPLVEEILALVPESSNPAALQNTVQLSKCEGTDQLIWQHTFNTGPNWSHRKGYQGQIIFTVCSESLQPEILGRLPATISAQVLHGTDACLQSFTGSVMQVLEEEMPNSQYSEFGEPMRYRKCRLPVGEDGDLSFRIVEGSGDLHTVKADFLEMECLTPGPPWTTGDVDTVSVEQGIPAGEGNILHLATEPASLSRFTPEPDWTIEKPPAATTLRLPDSTKQVIQLATPPDTDNEEEEEEEEDDHEGVAVTNMVGFER